VSLYLYFYGKDILKKHSSLCLSRMYDEEERIGSDYVVNLVVTTNLDRSSRTDDLKDTVDYVELHAIVKEEMLLRAKLLEHVANRILTRVLSQFDEVEKAVVKVAKRNPPIGGNVEEVSVKRELKRSALGLD